MKRLLKAIVTATIIATIGTRVASCSYNQSVAMFSHNREELVKAMASPVVIENYEEEHNNAQ